MSRRKKHKKYEAGGARPEAARAWHADLHPETKKSIWAIFSFLIAAILILSFIGKGGSVGTSIFNTLDFLLGGGYFFAPLSFILMGFSLLFSEKQNIWGVTPVGGALFLVSSLTIIAVLFGIEVGGFLGKIAALPLIRFFDFWASLIISVCFWVISILLILNIPLFRKKSETEEVKKSIEDVKLDEKSDTALGMKTVVESITSAVAMVLEKNKTESAAESQSSAIKNKPDPEREIPLIALKKAAKRFSYEKPPLDLLHGDRGTPSSGDIRANANIIKLTLQNFGIDVEMGEVSIGPTVTQYTLRPAEGVKLSRIVALHSDLALALAAHPIRIEAPIPGKSLVGIEVPNRSVATVGLRALIEQKTFQDSTNPLLFSLGRDVAGTPVFADLARMPHLLISGATGSGKSVCVHTIINSFLYRNPPEILKFIIVDPKRVELSIYNDIPHLLTPVITDFKKTIQALHWATKEMDRRYDLLSQSHTRDILSYNSQVAKDENKEILPYITIIIDELADLMAVYPREVEAAIIRLAQMARAVGIHLIVATQRPSVEVITGLIKANITSRIAFQVASQVDSRTILDMSGAEKLLGNGDMLFLAGDTGKPRRIQGAFISEQEVKRVVGFLKEESESPEYNEAILLTKVDETTGDYNEVFGDDDPLYEEAKELVVQAGKASASYLQRRLRVGYARAARLLDILEAKGIIGPGDGAKPREILIGTPEVLSEEIMDE